jgi:ATP-dependent HslUV protease subunit HslV
MPQRPEFHHTTVLAVRKDGKVAIAGDGQVTLDKMVVKGGAKKVRKIADDKVLVGFAGSAADAFALLGRFEEKLSEHQGRLERASVELVRDWRTDRALRRLEAMLVVADGEKTFLLSGTGDLIEPDDGILGVGSGSQAAVAAARALAAYTGMSAAEIVQESLRIAAGLDIYTNDNISVLEI